MPDRGPSSPGESIAARIDHLFRIASGPDGVEPSYRQVSANILARTGVHVGVTTLHSLRTGAAADPRMSTIEAIARYFGVPVNYFFDDEVTERVDAQLALLSALRDHRVQTIALRAHGLSKEALDMLNGVIEHARAAEGLDKLRQRAGTQPQ